MSDKEILFHVEQQYPHCAVTFFSDGSCTLHHNIGNLSDKWSATETTIYLRDYATPMADHFQEAYRSYIAGCILLDDIPLILSIALNRLKS